MSLTDGTFGMTQQGYRYLDHTADILVEAWGENIQDAFSEGARAMFDAMTEISQIQQNEEYSLSVTGHDVGELLYNWLEELLFQFETENLLGRNFQVHIQSPSENSTPQWSLNATVKGERFDPIRHVSKVGIKAITYSHLKISSSSSGFKLQFLLDI